MLDCGFSARETERRLNQLGRSAAELAGILLTHEHTDHMAGVGAVARQYEVPVWMSSGTHRAIRDRAGELPRVHRVNVHDVFAIGDIQVQPYPLPHDAREPCQFTFSDGCRRLGFLTDAGSLTVHMEDVLSGCDGLVIECNHDSDMLWGGTYPESLKRRIAGDHGHLDNEAAARLLSRLDTGSLQHLVLAHLSEKNNTEYLARAAVGAVLGGADGLCVARQDRVSSWYTFDA